MADSLRGTRGQRARGSSRASSARNSAVYDDHLQPPGATYLSRHGLRPMESRFSLNEQFASTRREYEFGFDDASSILERATLASNADDPDETLKVDFDPAAGLAYELSPEQNPPAARDYYELLCLARGPAPSPDQIRRAYYRLFRLLNSDRLPPHLRPPAELYLAHVQAAFETLIEPSRRLEYDAAIGEDSDSDYHGGEEARGDDEAQARQLLPVDQLVRIRRQEHPATTDLGIRLDASRFLQPTWAHGRRRRGRIRPLDLSISHVVNMALPALGGATQSAVRATQKTVADLNLVPRAERPIRCGTPVLSVAASAYALLEDLAVVPVTLLSDRYQPLLPETLPRARLIQLAEGRPSALVTARYRQELFWRAEDPEAAAPPPDAVVEVEMEVLPEPSTTTRVAHAVPIEGEREPVHVELMVNTGRSWTRRPPRAGVALTRRLRGGNAFLCADSGDWSGGPGVSEETCRFFDAFSRLNRRFFPGELVGLGAAPTVEVGFNVSPYGMGLLAGQALTAPADRGIKGLDADMDTRDGGSWTVSAAASAGTLASYLRYGRDVLLSPFSSSRAGGSNFRLEAELCATTNRVLGPYVVALRGLRRLGRLSKVGIEVGMSAYHLHLSLYFSRLSNRFRLPLLLAPRAALAPRLLFWTALVPLAALTAVDYYLARRRRQERLLRSRRDASADAIAARRAEADALTALLASAAEPRQTPAERLPSLVVLSAKYAAPGAPADEVADVTVAVAALVDGGALLIPAGVRKSRLLGFWDPAPGRTKELRVRFSYRGREGEVCVRGRDELRLPGGLV